MMNENYSKDMPSITENKDEHKTVSPQELMALLVQKQDLEPWQMQSAMHQIMTGQWSDAQVSAFLVGLRFKGETVAEITAAAQVMRSLSTGVSVDHPHLIDTCGTGGDGACLFNVSTAVSFVVAAAGGVVAKHGNRSLSSKSGAADVLEAAGVYLQLTPAQVAACVDNLGIGFMFAPAHHSAMRFAMPARKAIGIRTLFNVLGPLTNPAQVSQQLLGVFHKDWIRPMVEVLAALGTRRAIVVCGHPGLDEFSISGPSTYALLENGKIEYKELNPEDFGLRTAPLKSLEVSSPAQSLAIIQRIFKKESNDVHDPARDIVALNAGAALYVAGVTTSIAYGVELAQDVMANGGAGEKLSMLVNTTAVYRIEASDCS